MGHNIRSLFIDLHLLTVVFVHYSIYANTKKNKNIAVNLTNHLCYICVTVAHYTRKSHTA